MNDSSMMENYEEMKQTYKTTPVLTKFERCRVLGERSAQIMSGSSPFIENPERYQSPYEIAQAELLEGKIPFIIKRPYGNKIEYWKLKDLKVRS